MIREVWADNLDEEMERIRATLEDYPFVAMDTEFPGIVARPLGNFRSQSEFAYQTLRVNVDLLRIIQLGVCLSDGQGNTAPEGSTWQFNFFFSLDDDTFAQDSIDLLTNSGIDFAALATRGIDVAAFGELVMTSGLVLTKAVKWVTFHSSYDFGYFLKIVTGNPLPADEAEFFALLRLFFPAFYDVKHMMRNCKGLKGGLQDLADDLGIARIGTQHQAGSDSLLTLQAFFRLLRVHYDGRLDPKFEGVLFGLGAAGVDVPLKAVSSGPSTNPFLTGAFSSEAYSASS